MDAEVRDRLLELGATANEIEALTLAETHAADERLPDVRAGLATGEVVPFEGDYYGPVVNLASRVVSVARRGTIVVADEVRTALEGRDEFRCVEIRRRRLKDVGPVRLWVLRRGQRSR
jgi:adenylate cyclase